LLPDQLGPASPALPPGAPANDLPWLEPYPDSELEGILHAAPNPEARYSSREAVQLAFVAGLQQLPPRQRAALMLCDVLGWTAAEAAALLDGTTAAINSALQRARETMSKRYPHGRPLEVPLAGDAHEEILGRYLRAWEGHDLDGFVALLKEDAAAVMPPWLEWYSGRGTIRAFFEAAWKTCGGLRLVATAANGQPAFAVYERKAAGEHFEAHSLHVLTLENDAISTMTVFVEPRLVLAFGLPATVGD
jgi:RNA polymerase sigma-70 factor (ECF subfamily)